MKRLFALTAAALLSMTASAWAGGHCCGSAKCIEPPPPDCPDCSCPCEHRLHLCLTGHAHKYIEQLCSGDCCERIKAAEKLGCRLHADFCCDPEVLDALVSALQCDTCWEVRRAAAWSIAMQGARTEQGVLALYISSKMDHHFMVRDRATEALSILIICRLACFEELFKSGDELIKALKKAKYRPGTENCRILFDQCCASCDLSAPVAVGVAEALPRGEVVPVKPALEVPSRIAPAK